MIIVKSILAPSLKIADNENIKVKPAKFNSQKAEEKRILETTTYSTIIIVDGKYISLSITKYFGYQKPYALVHSILPPKGIDLFEEVFYWPVQAYTKPELNHLVYKMIKETEFHYKSKLLYELNWEVIDVKIKNGTLTLSNKERSHIVAIPPNNSNEPRYDYITDDGHYKFDCKSGEYRGKAIEIIVDKK
nr:hypothetical protein [uncultured archaeon]